MATVYGNDEPNILKGTAGADELYGGAGNDIGVGNFSGLTGSGDGASEATAWADIKMDPSGNDMIEGGTGSDVLYAGDGDDIVYGGEGDDGGIVIVGVEYFVAGLFGGNGNDTLYGGGGEDDLTGGLGQDHQWGGAGDDTFIFNAIAETAKKGGLADVIHDFNRKEDDVIDLSGIDAKEGGGDNAFKYIGADPFSGTKGELRYFKGKLQGDTDGDGKADFTVKLVEVAKLGVGEIDL